MSDPQAVGAFFDIDGTLVPSGSLELRFVLYLLSRGKLGVRNLLGWLLRGIRLAPQGWARAIQANKFYLADVPVSLAADWANAMALERLNRNTLPISPSGFDRIAWHQSRSHRVFLVSGTLAPLAIAVASSLPGQVEVVATELTERMRPAD